MTINASGSGSGVLRSGRRIGRHPHPAYEPLRCFDVETLLPAGRSVNVEVGGRSQAVLRWTRHAGASQIQRRDELGPSLIGRYIGQERRDREVGCPEACPQHIHAESVTPAQPIHAEFATLLAEIETLHDRVIAEFVTQTGISSLSLKLFPIVAYRQILIGQRSASKLSLKLRRKGAAATLAGKKQGFRSGRNVIQQTGWARTRDGHG